MGVSEWYAQNKSISERLERIFSTEDVLLSGFEILFERSRCIWFKRNAVRSYPIGSNILKNILPLISRGVSTVLAASDLVSALSSVLISYPASASVYFTENPISFLNESKITERSRWVIASGAWRIIFVKKLSTICEVYPTRSTMSSNLLLINENVAEINPKLIRLLKNPLSSELSGWGYNFHRISLPPLTRAIISAKARFTVFKYS